MIITPEQFRDMEHRIARSRKKPADETVKQSGVSLERESDLHEKIIQELKLRRYYFVHSRTDKRTTNQIGCPDFLIYAPFGIALCCEVKRKGSKLSAEQNVVKHVLTALGHRWAMVTSMDEFQAFLAANTCGETAFSTLTTQ